MLLTIFMAIVFCAAITILLISAVAFVQYDGTNKWFFSSASKEALEVLKPREKELFYGARTMGWVLMIISLLRLWHALLYAVDRILAADDDHTVQSLFERLYTVSEESQMVLRADRYDSCTGIVCDSRSELSTRISPRDDVSEFWKCLYV